MNNNELEKQLEQLNYDDALILLFSVCQQYGAREVFSDFRQAFPDMFDEIVVQINRLPPIPKAALLK
jgi:hypothetical protein